MMLPRALQPGGGGGGGEAGETVAGILFGPAMAALM